MGGPFVDGLGHGSGVQSLCGVVRRFAMESGESVEVGSKWEI